jgi:hypothetical protein
VEWIRAALDKKAYGTRPAQWADTILALDARHSGVLATPPILESYLSRRSCFPSRKHTESRWGASGS